MIIHNVELKHPKVFTYKEEIEKLVSFAINNSWDINKVIESKSAYNITRHYNVDLFTVQLDLANEYYERTTLKEMSFI